MTIFSEREIIDIFEHQCAIYPPGVVLGIGDDCALLQPGQDQLQVISTDTLTRGVHFLAKSTPQDIAYRALAVNVSDLAAMGAKPWAVVNALSLPAESDPEWVRALAHALCAAAKQFNVAVVGGNVSRGPTVSVTLTVFGRVPEQYVLLRSSAQVGDDVYVSGIIGQARWGLELLQRHNQADGNEAKQAIERYLRPRPRVELGLALRGRAHACIDVSDGLLSDAAKLAQRSGVSISLHLEHIALAANAPLSPKHGGLNAGDDYELLWTAPIQQRDFFSAWAEQHKLPVRRIGCVEPLQDEALILYHDGIRVPLAGPVFSHFGEHLD